MLPMIVGESQLMTGSRDTRASREDRSSLVRARPTPRARCEIRGEHMASLVSGRKDRDRASEERASRVVVAAIERAAAGYRRGDRDAATGELGKSRSPGSSSDR